MPALEAYKRELDYSYAPGVFPSMEALKKRPELVRRLLISSKGQESEGVQALTRIADARHIRVEVADKALSRISGKDNCFAAAVFEKRPDVLSPSGNHVVLHHISDAGNLGTILRTALGFGMRDIAVIRPAADVYDPHVVRASMGALFSLRIREYACFEAYRDAYPAQYCYPFMLDSSTPLHTVIPQKQTPYALIFGNEGAGLPHGFSQMGCPVRIPHSGEIDSLNLSVAAAIGMYAFTEESKND